MVTDYEALMLRAVADGLRALAEGRLLEHKQILEEVAAGLNGPLPAMQRDVLRSIVRDATSYTNRPIELRKCEGRQQRLREPDDNGSSAVAP